MGFLTTAGSGPTRRELRLLYTQQTENIYKRCYRLYRRSLEIVGKHCVEWYREKDIRQICWMDSTGDRKSSLRKLVLTIENHDLLKVFLPPICGAIYSAGRLYGIIILMLKVVISFAGKTGQCAREGRVRYRMTKS